MDKWNFKNQHNVDWFGFGMWCMKVNLTEIIILSSIKWEGNKIGNEGVEMLHRRLKTNSSLKVLNLESDTMRKKEKIKWFFVVIWN